MAAIDPDRPFRRARHLACLLRSDRTGATSIEYALIASIVSISILAGGQMIGGQLIGIIARVAKALVVTGSP